MNIDVFRVALNLISAQRFCISRLGPFCLPSPLNLRPTVGLSGGRNSLNCGCIAGILERTLLSPKAETMEIQWRVYAIFG